MVFRRPIWWDGSLGLDGGEAMVVVDLLTSNQKLTIMTALMTLALDVRRCGELDGGRRGIDR